MAWKPYGVKVHPITINLAAPWVLRVELDAMARVAVAFVLLGLVAFSEAARLGSQSSEIKREEVKSVGYEPKKYRNMKPLIGKRVSRVSTG